MMGISVKCIICDKRIPVDRPPIVAVVCDECKDTIAELKRSIRDRIVSELDGTDS